MSEEITREQFDRLLRPTVEFGREHTWHAIKAIVSDDGYWMEFATFCGQTVLSNQHGADGLHLSFPWDGESYSGCEACIEGALDAPPLPTRFRSQKQLLSALKACA